MASGFAKARKAGARTLAYEGDVAKPFTYKRDPRCLACRLGTRNLLGKQPAVGRQLQAWLVSINERR
jgi:hypothetical protein